MRNKLYIFLTVLGLIAIIVFLGWLVMNSTHTKYAANPYEYYMKELTKTDSSKLGYRQLAKIPLSLQKAAGIAIGKDDKIYVSGDSSLLVFDAKVKQISNFRIGKFAKSLAIDDKNQIYLGVGDHVEIYSADGIFQKAWQSLGKGSVITSIAVKNDFTYIAESEKGFVYQCNKDGKIIKTYGSKDTTDQIRRFVIPSYNFDIAVDQDDMLWVVNPGNHFLVNFSNDGSVYTYWGKTSVDADGFCGCCNPIHIALLNDGSFITAEKGIVRVKKYSHSGKFECMVAGQESFMEESLGLDVAVNSEQKIFVLEPQAKVVHVFEKLK